MTVREEKAQVVAELEEKLKSSKTVVFADYRGLNVADVTNLRRTLRDAGVEMRVVKNTLTSIAVVNVGYEGLNEFLSGPTAVAFGRDDPVAPAKLLIGFTKNNKNFVIKGGLVEGSIVGPQSIKSLADLPSREVLVSQVLRGLNRPISGLATVLQGPIRKLAYALKAVQDQKAAV
jgi:large subunit ribosomal protein L10